MFVAAAVAVFFLSFIASSSIFIRMLTMRKCPTIKLRLFSSSSSSQPPETDYCRFNRFDYITLFLSHVCDDRTRKRGERAKEFRDKTKCVLK